MIRASSCLDRWNKCCNNTEAKYPCISTHYFLFSHPLSTCHSFDVVIRSLTPFNFVRFALSDRAVRIRDPEAQIARYIWGATVVQKS